MWFLKIAKQGKAHFALKFCLPPGEQILIILFVRDLLNTDGILFCIQKPSLKGTI